MGGGGEVVGEGGVVVGFVNFLLLFFPCDSVTHNSLMHYSF